MVDATFEFYGEPFWDWKYGDLQGPEPVILVMEVDDEVVGCTHYLKVPYQLGGRELVGLAGGDLYVKPEQRRQHLSTELSLQGRRIVTESMPEAGFVVIFTWEALGSHYEKLLGYTRLDVAHHQWTKRLDWAPQLERLAESNPQLIEDYPRLADVHHRLRLEVGGAPPLELEVGAGGFTPEPPAELPVIRIRAPGPDSLKIRESGSPRVWAVAKVLGGQWRVSGSIGVVREALAVSDAYARVLRSLRKG